jgi:hypothetical protein
MTHENVANALSKMVISSGKTQRKIAESVGYDKPNVISMMIKGKMKVPLNIGPALAIACGGNPTHFMCLMMAEYQPEAWGVLSNVFGQPHSKD